MLSGGVAGGVCIHQGGQGGVCGGACRSPGGARPWLRQWRQQDAWDQCHEAGAGHHDAQREEVSLHSDCTLVAGVQLRRRWCEVISLRGQLQMGHHYEETWHHRPIVRANLPLPISNLAIFGASLPLFLSDDIPPDPCFTVLLQQATICLACARNIQSVICLYTYVFLCILWVYFMNM